MTISVKEKGYKETEAAVYLETKVNEMARGGWEFYRVDSIGVQLEPGCFGGMLSQDAPRMIYYVITFRRQA